MPLDDVFSSYFVIFPAIFVWPCCQSGLHVIVWWWWWYLIAKPEQLSLAFRSYLCLSDPDSLRHCVYRGSDENDGHSHSVGWSQQVGFTHNFQRSRLISILYRHILYVISLHTYSFSYLCFWGVFLIDNTYETVYLNQLAKQCTQSCRLSCLIKL